MRVYLTSVAETKNKKEIREQIKKLFPESKVVVIPSQYATKKGREKIRKYRKEYYQKNREKELQKKKERYQKKKAEKEKQKILSEKKTKKSREKDER